MVEQDHELEKLSLEHGGVSLAVTPADDGAIIVEIPGRKQVVIDRWGQRGPVEKATVRLG